MKKNIIITLAVISSLIFIVGFKENTNWQYKVISIERTGATYIEKAINQNATDGWQLDSTMVIPPQDNWTISRCNLIFKK